MTRSVDWLGLEVAYRADIKSLRQLAEDYGLSESAIRQKAKHCGWTRDGSALKREHVHSLFSQVADINQDKAEALALMLDEAAHEDIHDMQLGLANARLILHIAHQVLTVIEQDPQAKQFLMSDARNLKILSEATRHSIDVIRQIRQLDAPTQVHKLNPDDEAILERYVKDQQAA